MKLGNIVLITIALMSTILNAQDNDEIESFPLFDTVWASKQEQSIPRDILKKVEKNILLYRLIKCNNNEVDEFDNIIMKWDYFTTDLIEKNHVLCFSYDKIDTLNFPDEGYKIYLIKNDNFSKIDTVTLQKNYSFRSHGYSYEYSYLIAFDKDKPKNSQLLFLSGNFYKNGFYTVFNTQEGNLSSMKEMIKTRYFVRQIDKVDLINITKHHFIFRLTSSKKNRSNALYLKVDKVRHYEIEEITYKISEQRRKKWLNKKSIIDEKYMQQFKNK